MRRLGPSFARVRVASVFVALALVLGACGGASSGAAATTTATASRSMRAALPSGATLTIDEEGTVAVDGNPFGRFLDDQTFGSAEGEPLLRIGEAGALLYRDAPTGVRLVGNRVLDERDSPVLVQTDPTTLVVPISDDARVTLEGDGSRALLAIAAVMIVGTMQAQERAEEAMISGPRHRVPIDGAPSRGPADALVTLVVFSDFECPYCGRLVETLDELATEHPEDVRIVFRHMPLSFHPHAVGAAEAAAEAFAQGGDQAFWRMHDLLFQNREALGEEDLVRYAQMLGLDVPRFRDALEDHRHRAAVERDRSLGAELCVTGTPATFVNGRLVEGARPYLDFARVVDAAIAEARLALTAGVARSELYASLPADAERCEAPAAAEGDDDDESEDGGPAGGAAADAQDDASARYTLAVPPQAASLGRANAPVTIQLFSDFQCPYCARARAAVEELRTRYGDRVRVVWRDMPLGQHAWARAAAEVGREVLRQRGSEAFFRYHDLVFADQRMLGEATHPEVELVEFAARVEGVDVRRLRRSLEHHDHAAAIDADVSALRALEIRVTTPMFFVNGRLVRGPRRDELTRAVDAELAAH